MILKKEKYKIKKFFKIKRKLMKKILRKERQKINKILIEKNKKMKRKYNNLLKK